MKHFKLLYILPLLLLTSCNFDFNSSNSTLISSPSNPSSSNNSTTNLPTTSSTPIIPTLPPKLSTALPSSPLDPTATKRLVAMPSILGSSPSRYYIVPYSNPEVIIHEETYYVNKDDLASYIMTFKKLPKNYVMLRDENNKENKQARTICLNTYKESCRLYNAVYHNSDDDKYSSPYLSDGATNYTELDMHDDNGNYNPKSRGMFRMVFSLDPTHEVLYYTDDHYENYSQYLNYSGGWGQFWGNGNKKSNKHLEERPWVRPQDVTSLL